MFKFRLIPTLFTIPAVIVMLGLGVWQLQRLEWKETLIERLQVRAEAPAQQLDDGDLSAEADEFRNVSVTGRYVHEHEFFLVNRSLNGNPGMHVLTPLVLSDGSGAVLVNRGWVPFDKVESETRAQGLLQGEVTVTGLLRFPKGQGTFKPDNDVARNEWFFIDTDKMGEVSGLALADYYIMSGNKDVPGQYPVGRQWRLDIRNDHLQYAITWFSLATALIVVFLVYSRQQAQRPD